MKKKSTSMKKYSNGGPSPARVSRGTVEKRTSPGGYYKMRVVKDDQGNVIQGKERRTLKGFAAGMPRAKGKVTTMKRGGSTKK